MIVCNDVPTVNEWLNNFLIFISSSDILYKQILHYSSVSSETEVFISIELFMGPQNSLKYGL